MKHKPLDELEMFELFQVAYPEKFKDDDDATYDRAIMFIDAICGFDEMADLLGRVLMMTMPMESGITKRLSHCLGKVEIKDGQVTMIASARRDVIKTNH